MKTPQASAFKNKTVVVTGGTRGIGRAIADAFLERQANVIITGTGKGESVSGMTYIQADFLSADSLMEFCGYLETLPQIDICINNAGINRIASIDDNTPEDFDAVMAVNSRAPYLICSTVAGRMKSQRYGRIINIASIWSGITKAGRSAYSTSKAGIAGMTRAIAVDLAPFDILVNSISPGFVSTELTASSLSKAEMNELSSQVPLRRFAQPEEIAELAVFLASDLNTYITGQNIFIDGGFTNV